LHKPYFLSYPDIRWDFTHASTIAGNDQEFHNNPSYNELWTYGTNHTYGCIPSWFGLLLQATTQIVHSVNLPSRLFWQSQAASEHDHGIQLHSARGFVLTTKCNQVKQNSEKPKTKLKSWISTNKRDLIFDVCSWLPTSC